MQSKRIRTIHLSGSNTARRGLAAATALGLVLGLATTASAVNYSTSPGKNSAFEASTGNPLTAAGTTQLTATIEKGKKKTVIAVEATYGDGPYIPTSVQKRALAMNVTVNGVTMHPDPAASYQYVIDCGWAMGSGPPAACFTTGTFWLDIDAAELANPGVFVGQPLSIVLTAGDVAASPLIGVTPMDASLSVRVTKK